MLVNLVDNAVRHARTGVVLAVRGPDGAYHLVTVTDDGPGIPAGGPGAGVRPVHPAGRRPGPRRGRRGLGLAIVRELVRRAGGTVELADATPGAAAPGLRATVRLPALAEPDAE